MSLELFLHIERVADEVLLSMKDENDVSFAVAALPIPDGVEELIEALKSEAGL